MPRPAPATQFALVAEPVVHGIAIVAGIALLALLCWNLARGRAFAVQGAAIQGAGMFGYLAGGLLLEQFAPRPLIAACGLAGLVVVAVVAVPVTRAVRGERKAPRAAWATSAASA